MESGDRVGGYRIVGLVGRGGMGEVYRAHDPVLGRDVALKILPPAFAHDHERLARFRREAQVLASLNHPNIAQIYGLEELALVMEFVEGSTLADRIAIGPMPYEDCLPIARQIADALEAAHGQGIVHRDLKPANVKVRDDGTVKVLDFGLAKAMAPEGAGAATDVTSSPTITSPAITARGTFLGTAAYMAPEQARGRAVDRRADVWAFGCVLFEMLTGTRAFDAGDITDTIAAVLRGEPDWTKLPAELPPTFTALLKRCVTKDPRQRLRDMGDVRLVLEGAFDAPASSATAADRPVLSRRSWLFAAAGLFVGSIAAGFGAWWLRTVPVAEVPPVARFEIGTDPPRYLSPGVAMPLAISPDGSRLVFSAADTPTTTSGGHAYTRAIDQLAVLPVPGIDAPVGSVFLSPDGQWIGFFARDRGIASFRKVPVTGGTPTVLAKGFSLFAGASWSSKGLVAFSVDGGLNGVQAVSDAGGAVRSLTKPDKGSHVQPYFLPDGDRLLFTRVGGGQPSMVAVLDLATGEHRDLIEGEWPRYVPSGYLVFGRGSGLWAARFDSSSLQLRGQPTIVLDDVIPSVVRRHAT